MAIEQTREARLGILTYLLLGAALGASVLLGTLVLGLERVGAAIGEGLHAQIEAGAAPATFLLAFFVAAPIVALFVAILMGVRAARTGHDISGPAAVTTAFGLPILWVNLAAALLLSTALIDWLSDTDRFRPVFDTVVESIVFLALETAATVAFAALAAGIVRDAFAIDLQPIRHEEAPPMEAAAPEAMAPAPVPETERLRPPAIPEARTPSPSAEAAPPEPRPTQHGNRLENYPVECPRCETGFTVSGERPLRIVCPACEKTGTIR